MHTVSRLIDHFRPTHYNLSLNLQRTERVFSGIVTIEGLSTEGAKTVSVHSKDLSIESINLDGKTATWWNGVNDELHIDRPETAEATHIITIAFSGTITDAMHGLYPCYYEHDGIKKELLATQFESHHAREVFPCVDEPEAKATFDVTLTTENNITVLGNMPVRNQSSEDERLVTSFERTPRMSTYLLAWVTGELHRKTAQTKDGVEVNVWATPAQPASSLDFALDIATRSIEFYNDYFGVPYPLPKSDHIALPDFSSGAMENWGLITYREVALLADPNTTSISSKHYIATVIAHELAHQWFGNLVTMRWWNNLWLNESFATLMEYVAVDALQPEWNIWLDFSTYEGIVALKRDAIEGVQAVQVDVNHPDEISTLFDGAIVYAKGARLLRMLQYYIGHDSFQSGLRTYFTRHAYQNTEADDLWEALGSASGKDITRFMNTWISTSGYPVLSVTQEGDTVRLSQQQFFVGPHQPSDKLWPIPLGSTCSEMPSILDQQSLEVHREHTTTLRFNTADAAHFITNYSPELLGRLVEEVRAGTLDTVNRVQLLHEQTLLARSDSGNSALLIPLLDAYRKETKEAVWDIVSLTIAELKKFVEGTDEEPQLRKLAGDIARPMYERLGWSPKENEPEEDSKLRATIIGTMLYSEDPSVISEAVRQYESTDLTQLNPELRSLIIGAVVRHCHSPELIDDLLNAHKSSSSAELQLDIVSGLTSSKDPATLSRLLGLIKDESVVRHQDVVRWYTGILRNRDGRALAWNWLRDNWDWIEETFKGDKSYDDYPRYTASGLVSRQQLDEYVTFFNKLKEIPSLTRVISMGISELEGRVQLIERDREAVRIALRDLA
jgi:aminopeptidase N